MPGPPKPIKPAPKVISFVNLKGGVAKTTTAVQLAETLAFLRQKRVLVLDLDPQSNATLALIGEERWAQADDTSQTLAHLFLDVLNGSEFFNAEQAIIPGVSNLNRVPAEVMAQLPKGTRYGRVDLLPSSIRLTEVQASMQDISARTRYSVNTMEVVRRHVAPHFRHYDYVLIDTAPSLWFLTQNGLEVSDHYLIPTVPDRISTYAIAQIASKISDFRLARQLPLTCLGVLLTKYQSGNPGHQRILQSLPAVLESAFGGMGERTPPILSTRMPRTTASAEALAFERHPANYPEKYGQADVDGQPAHQYGLDLADEITGMLAR